MSAGSRRCKHAICYVNSNFMIRLIRRVRRARVFARRSIGCLFTSRPHIEEELVFTRRDRERLEQAITEFGIILRNMSRDVRAQSETLAYMMTEAIGKREQLTKNDKRDLWHLSAAVALGAHYFVTADKKLCDWINTQYRAQLVQLARQYFNRPLPYCINWEIENDCAQAARLLRSTTSQTTSDRSRSRPRKDAGYNGRVGKGRDKLERGRAKTKRASSKGKRKREWEKSQKSKVARRAPRRGARKARGKGRGG